MSDAKAAIYELRPWPDCPEYEKNRVSLTCDTTQLPDNAQPSLAHRNDSAPPTLTSSFLIPLSMPTLPQRLGEGNDVNQIILDSKTPYISRLGQIVSF
jgi:hypothetical protein